MELIRFLISIIFLFSIAQAQEVPTQTLTTEKPRPWAEYFPYVPEKNEYNFEWGGMWEKNNLNWMGLTYGHHVGNCMFSTDIKCQQFVDVTAGAGFREGTTEGLFLVGPRWQYVRFPEPFSPSIRVFGGMMNVRDASRDHTAGVYGLDVAFTVSLHKKLNLKWDTRLAGGDQFWSQSMISFSLKIDDWVDQFAGQMKKMSVTTIETTGSILRTTIQAPMTLMDWFNKPKDNNEVRENEQQHEK